MSDRLNYLSAQGIVGVTEAKINHGIGGVENEIPKSSKKPIPTAPSTTGAT